MELGDGLHDGLELDELHRLRARVVAVLPVLFHVVPARVAGYGALSLKIAPRKNIRRKLFFTTKNRFVFLQKLQHSKHAYMVLLGCPSSLKWVEEQRTTRSTGGYRPPRRRGAHRSTTAGNPRE